MIESGRPAQLNFGDCFAYALAKEADESLLFTGKDFEHTDVKRIGAGDLSALPFMPLVGRVMEITEGKPPS